MEILRHGSAPFQPAPEQAFTGDVLIGGYFQRQPPSQLAGAIATFAPGSRTPWKSNPGGQTVIVTDGMGWAQSEGDEIVKIQAGDLIWFVPGQRHWEGATPDQAMTHVVLQESGVQFGERVTDEQYLDGPA